MRLPAWLANRGLHGADAVVATVLEATLPGEDVAGMATRILALGGRLKRVGRQICESRERFRDSAMPSIISSSQSAGVAVS